MTTTTARIATGIRCGSCHGRHDSTDAIRACCAGLAVEPHGCTWLYEAGIDEDGGRIIRECGADIRFDAEGRSECSNGHTHVPAEVRYRERWDYAADAAEADGLRRNLVDAVAMDGTGI